MAYIILLFGENRRPPPNPWGDWTLDTTLLLLLNKGGLLVEIERKSTVMK